MPILSHFLPAILITYWSLLAECFGEWFFAILIERCHNHLLVKLAHHLDFAPLEAACAAYRHQDGPGAPPTYPTKILARCLLLMYLEPISLRQLEQRLYSDMLMRWFVGLSAFGSTPDHSTIERFTLWVEANHPRLYYDTVLKQIDEHFPNSRKLDQIGDTYGMVANAAEEGLTRRLRHTSECLLEEAVRSIPDQLTAIVGGKRLSESIYQPPFAWVKLFGKPREANGFYLDEQQRFLRIQETALAARDLQQRFSAALQLCKSQDFPDLRLWVGHLGKILYDNVSFLDKPGAEGQWIHLRTAKERRHDPLTNLRIGSATDPEATYRVHGENEDDILLGYNVQLAASTDGFIRETQAYTGAISDQAGIANLVAEQKEHLGCCPPKLVYDQAGGSGKARADVARVSDGQTQLVSKLLPYEKRSNLFGPYDFSLSQDGLTLTCPANKQSSIAYATSALSNGRSFRFAACLCWLNGDPPQQMAEADLSLRCPLWEKCRGDKDGPGVKREVFVSDYRDFVLASKVYNQTEDFHIDMQQRPLIERIVFELTHYNGARRCRSRGLAKADFQAKMCATAYNLKLWMRKISQAEYGAPRPAAITG